MMEFIEAHEGSFNDGTFLKGVAEKTGLTTATCQAKASKFRNPEYKKSVKTDAEGNVVYRRAVEGAEGETETTDETLAKRSKQDKPITISIYDKDANGKRLVIRRPIPLREFPRGSHSRLESQVDDAMALLAKLRGETVDTLVPAGQQEETDESDESEDE